MKLKVLFAALIISSTGFSQNVIFNEICATVGASFVDDFGEFEDWIEVYNPGDKAIDLSGWFISDDSDHLNKYRIPLDPDGLVSIEPGGYLVLWADKDLEQGPHHVNIQLSKEGEEIFLSKLIDDQLKIIDRIRYPAHKSDQSYGRCQHPEPSWKILDKPSPGIRNICPDVKVKQQDYIPKPSPPESGPEPSGFFFNQSNDLRINELVARNSHGISDEFGETDDWIEIYNPGAVAVNLAGWYVSDTLESSSFYRIPSFDLTKTLVPAGGYLILWADGEPAEGVAHLPFKFDNEGEEFYLARMVNNNLTIVDQVVFPSLERDVPYGRYPNASGSFRRLSDPTPNAANLAPRTITGFIVNEIMAVRGSGFLDEVGEEEDWIEFFNPNATAIDLGGMYITDSLDDKVKYRIPTHKPDSTTLAPGAYLIFFADNDENQGIRHLGFKLGGGGERIAFIQPDGFTQIDVVRYPYQASDASYGRFPNGGAQWLHTKPTPGAANQYQYQTISGLYLNEILAENAAFHPDPSGLFEDWIEIYNSNNYPVNVGGLYISDSLNDPLKFRIPNTYPDSTTIPANGFLVFWADNDPEEGVLHLDIRLSAAGEQVGLSQFRDQTVVLDSHTFSQQVVDRSIGRYPDGSGSWTNLQSPSPGAKNTGTVVQRTTGLYINEFMARNLTTYPDESGNYTDWIEVYNSNSFPVNLGGMFFTNILSNPEMSLIPGNQPNLTTVPAKGFLVFRPDLNPGLGPLHLSFTLKGNGDQIGLFERVGGTLYPVDTLSYGPQSEDVSYGRTADGASTWKTYTSPTPGMSNGTQTGPIQGLYINEFMARNTRTLTDETGAYEDWIEIFNSTNNPIDLSGLYLTENLQQPLAFQLPVRPDKLTVPSKGYLLLWPDGKPEVGPTHLHLQLAGAGESIGLSQLYNGSPVFLDQLTYPPQTADVSYGRMGDGGTYWAWFRVPTPNSPNSTTGLTIMEALEGVAIRPVPFKDFIQITLPEITDNQFVIEVLNIQGRLVYSKKVKHQGNTIMVIDFNGTPVMEMPSGICLIRIISGTKVLKIKSMRE